MKAIVGLGNPGREYESTRHNVGWWVVDRLTYDWGLGPLGREGDAWVTDGRVGGHDVVLLKPITYMNRSGLAVGPLRDSAGFDPSRDLLVVVDDAALDVARVRFRPRGSPGGHNGLKSVSLALGSDEYPRLRIGVGRPPAGANLVDWVLSPLPKEDEQAVVDLLPELTPAVELWLDEGTEAAMNRFNR